MKEEKEEEMTFKTKMWVFFVKASNDSANKNKEVLLRVKIHAQHKFRKIKYKYN